MTATNYVVELGDDQLPPLDSIETTFGEDDSRRHVIITFMNGETENFVCQSAVTYGPFLSVLLPDMDTEVCFNLNIVAKYRLERYIVE